MTSLPPDPGHGAEWRPPTSLAGISGRDDSISPYELLRLNGWLPTEQDVAAEAARSGQPEVLAFFHIVRARARIVRVLAGNAADFLTAESTPDDAGAVFRRPPGRPGYDYEAVARAYERLCREWLADEPDERRGWADVLAAMSEQYPGISEDTIRRALTGTPSVTIRHNSRSATTGK